MDNILSCIGNTPLMEIKLKQRKNTARIFAKLEFLNPSGSVKDRIAKYIIEKAEEEGKLKKNSIIVEATSGNTGIGLSMVGAVKGYQVVIFMPEHMSKERIKIMRAFGAKVVLTPKKGGFVEPVERALDMAKRNKRVFLADQFANPHNTEIHRLTTGREIIKQCRKKINAFVAGIGTGGTLMGVAEALRRAKLRTKIVAVEPHEAAILSGEVEMCSHHIAGIGDGFIPDLVNRNKIDEVVKIKSKEAIQISKQIIKKLGIPVGVSSGANYLASLKIAEKLGSGKCVVTVFPDRMERYFSTALFK